MNEHELPFVAQKPSCESRKRFVNLSKDLQRITSTEQVQRNLRWNLESLWPCCTFGDKPFLSLLEASWPFAGDGDGNVDALLQELT